MKVEINNKEQNNEIKFPCLMEAEDDYTIILATSEREGGYLCGVCLKGTFEGQFADDWLKTYFKPLKNSITLQND